MGRLLLYHESNMRRQNDFVDQLSAEGVRLEQWSLQVVDNVRWISSTDILSLYRLQIDQVKQQTGLNKVDLITVDGSQQSSISIRDKHLSEHTHVEDEVRLFLSGEALLFINVRSCIHCLHCLPGDFILIPKGVRHWLDMGPRPDYQCIRWYDDRAALANQLTGSYVAESTPRWEALLGKPGKKVARQ